MYSPFVMVLGNLISGVLFLLDSTLLLFMIIFLSLQVVFLFSSLNSFVTLSGINSVFITN